MSHLKPLLPLIVIALGVALLSVIGKEAWFYVVLAIIWAIVLRMFWKSGASSRYGRAAAWAFEQGDYQRAIEAYTALLNSMPRSPEVLLCRGAAYFNVGDVDRAIEDWNEAARLRPEFAEAHANLGNVQMLQGDLEAATKSLAEALRLDPRLTFAHYHLGCASLFVGNFIEAADRFRAYSASDREQFEESFVAGCHDDANDPRWTAYVRESMRLATLAIESNAQDANAHVARAIGRLHFREYSEALADCEAALNLTPDDCLALYLRGFAHKELGHEAEAAADLGRARNLACPPAKADVK